MLLDGHGRHSVQVTTDKARSSTSQIIDHRGVSLSKQHTAVLLVFIAHTFSFVTIYYKPNRKVARYKSSPEIARYPIHSTISPASAATLAKHS